MQHLLLGKRDIWKLKDTLQKLSDITGIDIPPEEFDEAGLGVGAIKKYAQSSESSALYKSNSEG